MVYCPFKIVPVHADRRKRMEIEVTVIVKKVLCVEGPKDVDTAIDLIRKMLEGDNFHISTFQKWVPGRHCNPTPVEKLLHIVDMREHME